MINQKEIEELNDYLTRIFVEEKEKDRLLKLEWRKKLIGLINVTGLFKWLDEHDYWIPIGIVEIYNTNEKESGYNSYQHVRIKDDKYNIIYVVQNCNEIRGVNIYCVWQTCSIMSDDYSGYLLFPLKNGKYFKVGYSC
jgi:hypothetical protein